ncbi:neurofilament medium polypeptide-like isoform X2 [Rhineura floridana]|uniref:neurofilament medium polypeptide-like isoform X2 n=1 Tax=Rhineura floridana TaxID=261503 RepID=UPI002AC7F0B6|nr:neurofilament medium polypeptide-like isoform X2 [Rhineura floridana]
MTSHWRDFRSRSSSFTSPGASYNVRRERSCSPSSRNRAYSGSPMGVTTSRIFSSSSLTGYSCSSFPKVSINKRLLTPLHVDIDPSFHEIRTKEKDEIKILNNQFAALIGKVQSLEQHNQVLLTRWNFLKEQDNSLSDLDIKLLYDQYMNKLRMEIRSIDTEKEQLDSELDEVLDAMDSFRNKYEEEINKRTGMEFTFTALKKDLDNGFLHKTELEAKLSGLLAVAELMKKIHEEELEEVMSQIKDVSVVLGIDNNRYNPDPHRIVEEVRAQYEDLAIRSWEELETLTRSKLKEREVLSAKYGDHLLNDRRVIAELNIQIQKMRSCIVSLKSQCLRLEDNIKEAGVQGESALNDAKAKLAKLEEAIHNARQDLAHLVKEYQDLMNIKLALDIEILTYRELMEGEEISMESPSPAVISRIYSTPKLSSSNTSITTTSNVATIAKEHSTDKMNHSGSSLECSLSRNESGRSGEVSAGDFSRSHSKRSGGPPESSFSRSHSSASGGASEASRSHSSIHTGTLESSPRSSRSGNYADLEDAMESSVSRSQGHGSGSYRSRMSGDNLEESLSRSLSGEIKRISEGSLSRSQSNRSSGLTDSVFARTDSGASENVQEGSCSRSQSHSSIGFSPSSFSRAQNRGSDKAPETILSRYHSSGSRIVSEGNNSSSQSSRSGDFTENVFARAHSGESEGISEGSLSRNYSGTSVSYVEDDLSRSQSDENEIHDNYRSEKCAEPSVYRTNSAEDGGVPVGDISRSHSRASSFISDGSLSRSQNVSSHGSEEYPEPIVSKTNSAEDGGVPVGGISRNQNDSSHGSGDYAESSISRTNSAEDGGVPVGGIPRSQNVSSHGSEDYAESSVSRPNSAEDGGVPVGGISRSQNDSSHGSEGYPEPIVSRTNSAEDGGVPVGGISRSQSGASSYISDGSHSRSQSDGNEIYEGYAEPTVSRTNSAEDGGVPVGGVSRSSSRDSRNNSQRSQRGHSGSFADTVFIKARTEGAQEGSLSRHSSDTNATFGDRGVSRSHSGGGKGISQGSGFRTPSIRSATLTDSVFIRTPSNAGEDVPGELLSRFHNDARESVTESSLSPGCHSPRSEGSSQSGLSRLRSGESRDDPDSNPPRGQSSGSKVIPESSFSRSQSNRSGGFTDNVFARTYSGTSEGRLSRSQTDENEGIIEVVSSRSHGHGSGSFAESSVSRSHSAESEGVPENALSRSQNSRSGKFVSGGLLRDHSNESKESHCNTSERFVDNESYASHSEAHESGLSRNTVASADSFTRSHSAESGGPVETSTPICPHRRSEDAMEHSLSRSHSGESGSFKAADFYRSSSEVSRGVSEAGLSRSFSKENENIPEGTVSRSYSYRCAMISHPNVSRTESGGSEDVSESSLCRCHSSESGRYSEPRKYSRSQSGERGNGPEVGLSRSYSGRNKEAPVDNLCISHSTRDEAFPQSGLYENYRYEHEAGSDVNLHSTTNDVVWIAVEM